MAEKEIGELDRCVCSHLRRDHSGRNEKKRCVSKIFAAGALGDGKCDCVEFRLAVPQKKA